MALVKSNPLHTETKLEIDVGQEEAKTAVAEHDESGQTTNKKNTRSCPPWLYYYTTSYAAGVLVWITLIAMALSVWSKFDDEDDGDDGWYTNATSCDADPLGDLAAHFFDESCVEAMSCDDQAMLTLFMYEFFAPLRVEMTAFIQCYLLTNFMVVQQGGIPSTTKDDDGKSRCVWSVRGGGWCWWGE